MDNHFIKHFSVNAILTTNWLLREYSTFLNRYVARGLHITSIPTIVLEDRSNRGYKCIQSRREGSLCYPRRDSRSSRIP